jgi:hypothetical protein
MEPSIVIQSGRYTLTRSQVARRIDRSLSTVRRLEFVKLHAVADENGVFRFDADEVDALARELRDAAPKKGRATSRRTSVSHRSGLLAARTFAMFARRWSLPRIVTATKQTPSRVRVLYHEWVTSLEAGELDSTTGASAGGERRRADAGT